MRDVYIIAVGMTKFGKHMDRTEKDLVAEALAKTISDVPELRISDIQSGFLPICPGASLMGSTP